jgi:hypothetical protein
VQGLNSQSTASKDDGDGASCVDCRGRGCNFCCRRVLPDEIQPVDNELDDKSEFERRAEAVYKQVKIGLQTE